MKMRVVFSYLVATTAFVKGAVLGTALALVAAPCATRMLARRR